MMQPSLEITESEFSSLSSRTDSSKTKTEKNYKKKVGAYIMYLRKVLGKGTFSTVYYGEKYTERPATGIQIPFAIKEIAFETLTRILGPLGLDAMQKEINICAYQNHKNIVRLYDVLKTEHNFYLVFEHCGGGDLREFLKEKKSLPEPVV